MTRLGQRTSQVPGRLDRPDQGRLGSPRVSGSTNAVSSALALLRSPEQPLGSLGRRFDRRSPFYVGLVASAGVAVTYGAVRVLESVSSILLLIGVAFFLALGLEPAASWFVNRKLPRWAATTLVFVIFLVLLGAFVAAAIPPLTQQAGELINQSPALHSVSPRPLLGHRQTQRTLAPATTDHRRLQQFRRIDRR